MKHAPSKTMRFSPEVCTVIAAMTWEQHNEKFAGVITQQLDRKAYVAVNKALAALGGKWSRQARAHLFVTDPRPQIIGLLDTETLTVTKDGYFPTPYHIAQQMVEMAHIGAGMTILEPSAGTGELAEVIRQKMPPGCDLSVIELHSQRAQILRSKGFSLIAKDFLTQHGHWDRIIQNPPFEIGQDIIHVRHAYDCLHPGGRLVSVMGEGAFFRSTNRAVHFRSWLESVQHETEQLPPKAFRESGSGANARLVTIERDTE